MFGLRFTSTLSLTLVSAYSFASFAATSVLAQTKPSAEEPNRIQGVVLNSVTHEPVGRALVYSPDNRFATMTDARGHFQFVLPDNPAANSTAAGISMVGSPANSVIRPASLMARKPGFLSSRDQPDTLLLPDQTDVTLYLVPEALVVGRLNMAEYNRVEVELYRREIRNGTAHWTSAGRVESRSNGEFRFADLAPGTYKLFTHEQLDRDPLTFDPRGPLYGYPPVYFPNANNFAAATAIQLTAGSTQQVTLTPVRHAYYPVEIGVANAPATGALDVIVSIAGQPGPGYSLGFNQERDQILGSLPDGTYTVEATTFGPNTADGVTNITVSGAPLRGHMISLFPTSPIRVNVSEDFTTKENGDFFSSGPVAADGNLAAAPRRPQYLQIWLESADDFVQRPNASLSQSNDPNDTSLFIDNAQPGRYWVHIGSGRGYVATAECGSADILHHPLVVPPGGETSPIEITVRDDGADVDGAVEDAPAQKPVQIYFIPVGDSAGQLHQFAAYGNNHFSFSQIAPGDYRVFAFNGTPNTFEYTNPDAIRKYESSAQYVRLLPGQKQHLTLHLGSQSD